MCEAMKPKVAVITNITPDHLDRHKTFENYVAAKARVFKNMDADDTLILNMDDETVRALAPLAKCRIKYFTLHDNPSADVYFKGGRIIINNGGPTDLIGRDEMKLMGMHNVANVMCAGLAAVTMGAGIESVRQTLRDFTPVEHRMEFVAEKRGVMYVNDSKGTNPDASITAIRAIDRPIILIMGGYDKKSSFDEIMDLIAQKVKHVVILGDTKQKIAKTADEHGYKSYTLADDYEQAVAVCGGLAEEGDCVLLSPASASWDMFDNYETRGRLFKELVNKLH
jgi:UDP-N-acetylmuramoylalanine--D-glutamate ligase